MQMWFWLSLIPCTLFLNCQEIWNQHIKESYLPMPTGDFSRSKATVNLFGGMSVLEVGDFYQRPPLGKAKPLCVYEEGVLDLCKDNF